MARDDITIEGAGDQTVIQLATGVHDPVFVLGEPVPYAPTITHRNITLRKMRIRGYRFPNPQPGDELSSVAGREHLRNNGVTVRQAENCLLEDLTIESTASGGVMLERTCKNIRLHNITSFGHRYDGVAWDGDVQACRIEDCTLRDNGAAGISFDIGPADNAVTNCQIYGNATVGIFIRDSRRNTFTNCVIRGNQQDGVFIADGDRTGASATDNVFEDNQYLDNGRNGIWQAGQRSVNNTVRGGTFRGNAAKPIEQSFPDTAPLILVNPTILP
ncbi:MAG: right-handed parallel beta-helix repeat-containing protein [Phycisphaerae bacterium]